MKLYTSLFLVFIGSLSMLFAQKSVNRFDSNGNKTGTWVKKYTNGNIRYTGQFLNDKEVGVFKFYSEFYSNHPVIVKTYKPYSDICKVQFYTKTGLLESEGEMKVKNRIGKWLYYDIDGKTIVLEENYKQGKLSGIAKVYYKDGSLTEQSYYENGKLHGESTRYTEKGKLIARIPYKHGEIDGKVFYYHNTGVIRETGFYDHGKRVGKWEFYIDGVLAGFKEPNKKIEKEPMTLEELEERKKNK